MRTHWGYVKVLCQHCKETMNVLLIQAHQREGIGCRHCFRKAAPAGEVQALMAQIEERDSAEGTPTWGGSDAAA